VPVIPALQFSFPAPRKIGFIAEFPVRYTQKPWFPGRFAAGARLMVWRYGWALFSRGVAVSAENALLPKLCPGYSCGRNDPLCNIDASASDATVPLAPLLTRPSRS